MGAHIETTHYLLYFSSQSRHHDLTQGIGDGAFIGSSTGVALIDFYSAD